MSAVDEIRELPDLLPDEVWTMVFAHLPLADRQSVRLSCQRFYQICNCVRFQKNEQIVLCGKKNIKSLSRSRRRTWNVKLTGVHYGGTCVLEFFKIQGSNVYSLTADGCCLAPGIFGRIIEHCDNLRDITLLFDSVIDLSFYAIVFEDLRILRTMGVVHDKVANFSLELPYHPSWLSAFYDSADDFPSIFDVFPRIDSKIKLTVGVQNDKYIPFSHSAAIERFSFSGSYDEVKENLMVKVKLLQKSKMMGQECLVLRGLSAQLRQSEQLRRQSEAFQRVKKKPRLS